MNKHQPKLNFVKAQSKDTSRHGNIKSLSTAVITYLPASNCFYSIFAPMPVAELTPAMSLYPPNGYNLPGLVPGLAPLFVKRNSLQRVRLFRKPPKCIDCL
jgi:hypothetical protein